MLQHMWRVGHTGDPTVDVTEDGSKRTIKSTGLFSGVELHLLMEVYTHTHTHTRSPAALLVSPADVGTEHLAALFMWHVSCCRLCCFHTGALL